MPRISDKRSSFLKKRAARKTKLSDLLTRSHDCLTPVVIVKRVGAVTTSVRHQQELAAARDRLQRALSRPSMSAEALREQIARSAKWEDENAPINAYAGLRR